MGLKYKDGVILIVDKRISSKLIIIDSIEKMYKIDDHIGFTTSASSPTQATGRQGRVSAR